MNHQERWFLAWLISGTEREFNHADSRFHRYVRRLYDDRVIGYHDLFLEKPSVLRQFLDHVSKDNE